SVLTRKEVMLHIVSIKAYDDYTYTHSMMVGLISVLIGVRLGLTEYRLNELAVCGLMHDLGKVDIPVNIINKPEKLNDDEYAIIRMHPESAVRRLRGNRACTPAVLQGIASHHEKYDGTGYPQGLSGERIPLYGRILALADVFDALTSKRSYRENWTPEQAIEYMMGLANIHFDFNLLNSFLSVIAAYPVGSIVRLSNGYTSVVIRNTPGMTLRPTVRVLEPPVLAGIDIDLAKDLSYLNVTISKMITDTSTLSDTFFQTKETVTP
ncbi:MAG: HD-GYP domain-containing protein, partial [Angelakisella sp.]